MFRGGGWRWCLFFCLCFFNFFGCALFETKYIASSVHEWIPNLPVNLTLVSWDEDEILFVEWWFNGPVYPLSQSVTRHSVVAMYNNSSPWEQRAIAANAVYYLQPLVPANTVTYDMPVRRHCWQAVDEWCAEWTVDELNYQWYNIRLRVNSTHLTLQHYNYWPPGFVTLRCQEFVAFSGGVTQTCDSFKGSFDPIIHGCDPLYWVLWDTFEFTATQDLLTWRIDETRIKHFVPCVDDSTSPAPSLG